MRARRVGLALLFASAGVFGSVSSGYSFTLTDDPSVTGTNNNPIYYGATDSYNHPPSDIIGSSPPFGIIDAVVNRATTSALNDTLNIKIYTNYAGQSGVDGTTYGSLFLNPVNWSVNASTTNYTTDSFANGNQNWAYAVTTPSTSGSTGLYATGLPAAGSTSGSLTATNYYGTPQYYTTSGGQIVMSNAYGDPISAPNSHNDGWYFRQGQAVLFNPIPALRSVEPRLISP